MQVLTVDARLELLLAERAHVDVSVEDLDGTLTVFGTVRSVETREAVTGLLARSAPGCRVLNNLLVLANGPDDLLDAEHLDADATLRLATACNESELSSRSDPLDEVTSGAEPMFAPVDPVLSTDQHGRPVVLGGFSPDSMTALSVEPSAGDQLLGDEAIAEAVDRELKQDSATTNLAVHVLVRRGVVRLRGAVGGLEDVDSAEEVAARVPGVREVIEELHVA
jgi:osmotically-inducible protein OsmY